MALLVVGGHAWAQNVRLTEATGGAVGRRLFVLPKNGPGGYSWALPGTLSGLLRLAGVDTMGTEKLAALLKRHGMADLGKGLPDEWKEGEVQAAAEEGQVGKDKGYVLVASWNSQAPSGQWDEETQFWLVAKLQKGEEVVFDTTRLPKEGEFYKLKDYDSAVRDLAEKVVEKVNPKVLEQARQSQEWQQRITLEQVRLLAEAEKDIAAGKLREASAKLEQAQKGARGEEGAWLALRRLMEVNKALSAQDPAGDKGRGQQMEEVGRRRLAEREKAEAWDRLSIAEGCRLQGKWDEAAEEYFPWVQYLVRQKLMQPEDVYPVGLRQDLKMMDVAVGERVKGCCGLQAEWWGTVGLALYRGVSGDLAQTMLDLARKYTQDEPKEAVRADALLVVARQVELTGDLAGAEVLYQAALKILERVAAGSEKCAVAYTGLGRIYDTRGQSEAALAWHNKALDIRNAKPGSREWAESANNIAIALLHMGKGDPALGWCNNAREALEAVAPGSLDLARVYMTLGEVQLSRGETEEALKVFKRALPILAALAPGSPEYIRVCNNVGEAHLRKGERKSAAEWFKAAQPIEVAAAGGSLNRRPNLPDIGGDVNQKVGSGPDVRPTEKATAAEAGEPPELANIGRQFHSEGFDLLLKGKPQEALPQLLRAFEISPGDVRMKASLVWGYVALNHLAEAGPMIDEICAKGQKALAGIVREPHEQLAKQLLDGGNPAGYYLLGRLWEASGEREKAAGAYETFLKTAKPDHPWRGDAEARVKKPKGGGGK
jgi:tetratricopeptide (TPR) repeat protein